jgi:ATP-binding cassette subfamily F protein uup
VLLVSHDRRFLDNIVTQTIAAEGNGRWREYVGGYTDWLVQKAASAAARAAGAPSAFIQARPAAAVSAAVAPASAPRAKSRLGYKDQRELEALPKEIEVLEAEQTALLARMSSMQYRQSGAEAMRADSARAGEIEQDMARKFARWEQLEELRLKSG